MKFENGLEDIIEKDRNVSGGYRMPDEFIHGCRGNVAFVKILSDSIKGKEISSAVEFLAEVGKVFERLTGVKFSMERDLSNERSGCTPDRAFSQEIYDSDPYEEGSTWGGITLDNWIGERPVALKFICEHYGLE